MVLPPSTDLSQPTELHTTLVTFLVPSIFGLLLAVLLATIIIVALCVPCCSHICLPFCFSRNSDAKQARFVEQNLPGDNTLEQWRNLLERAERVLTEMPTHLEEGRGSTRPEGKTRTPAGPPPPTVTKKRQKCRLFCCDTERDKKAKENYEELERLLGRIDSSSLMSLGAGLDMTDTMTKSGAYELHGYESVV